MSKGGPGQHKGGENACKVCNHPGRTEIDAMLLNGAKYRDIIARMKAAHPGEPELIPANLSRHKTNHLLTQPITVVGADGETEGYIVGHLTTALTVNKEAIPAPSETVTIPEALRTVMNAGVKNIQNHPELVTPIILMQAIDTARKMGILSSEQEEFAKAWADVGKRKEGLKRKVKRTVTVSQEEEVEAHPTVEPAEPIIEAEVVTPAEWSDADLKLLEAPDGENKEAD